MEIEGQNAVQVIKDDQEEQELVDHSKGESLQKQFDEGKDKKSEAVEKPSTVNEISATEGATASKIVCTTSDEEEELESEVLELPSKAVGGRSSHTDLHNLLTYSPKPQPPLTEKQLKIFQQGKDPTTLMMEQVNKMKHGMERLQEITQKFNCMEKYKDDVDFLVKNLAKSLVDNEPKQEKKEEKPTTK